MTIPGLQLRHLSPGRIRVKLDKIRGNTILARELEQRLALVEHLQDVEVNPTTGSVLITYNTHLLATREQEGNPLGDIVHELLTLAKTMQLIPPQHDTSWLEQLVREPSTGGSRGLTVGLANTLRRWLTG